MPQQDPFYWGPLDSPGVEHATVSLPSAGSPPDPLGILAANPPTLPQKTSGGGDDVNEWKQYSPAEQNFGKD